uniref:Uncharacterized protein n=1 Tax=Lactuca sativa TaxID=4236 RepID=A0A9R1W4K8_LACSA|nr:hypothetical protein LSAT_V11C300141200 [Lactuca sativa]
MTTSKSNSSWSGTSRRKNREIIRCSCGDICPIYDEDGGCGHFKWVDEEEDEFRAFKKQLNLQHKDIESVMLLKLIVGLLVSILVCLVVVVIKM